MQILKNSSGSAMIISLLVMLMVGLLGIAAVQNSNTEMDIAYNYQTEVKAFYVAEAGIELAYAEIRNDPTWRAGFLGRSLNGGSFDVTMTDSTIDSTLIDTLVILATGRRNHANVTLEVKLVPQTAFGWAAFGDEWLTACGDHFTDSFNSDSGSYFATRLLDHGDVGSNGHVDVCGSALVNGDALTSNPGDMDVTGSAVVAGDTTTQAPPRIFDPIPDADFDFAKANNTAPAGLSGDYSYNPGNRRLSVLPGRTLILASGVYYFSQIDLKGAIELAPGAEVEIYLDGDAKINAGAEINAGGQPADLMMFARNGDFTVNGQAIINMTLYAPTVDFKLVGGAELYGAFIAKTVKDGGGSDFHYDRALSDLVLPGKYMKVSWREI